jgi:hypothetical protein
MATKAGVKISSPKASLASQVWKAERKGWSKRKGRHRAE